MNASDRVGRYDETSNNENAVDASSNTNTTRYKKTARQGLLNHLEPLLSLESIPYRTSSCDIITQLVVFVSEMTSHPDNLNITLDC